MVTFLNDLFFLFLLRNIDFLRERYLPIEV